MSAPVVEAERSSQDSQITSMAYAHFEASSPSEALLLKTGSFDSLEWPTFSRERRSSGWKIMIIARSPTSKVLSRIKVSAFICIILASI